MGHFMDQLVLKEQEAESRIKGQFSQWTNMGNESPGKWYGTLAL